MEILKTFFRTTLIVLLVAAAAAAQEQAECQTCQICNGSPGGVPLVDCVPGLGAVLEDIPSAELAEPETEGLSPAHAYVARKFLERWPDLLAPIFEDSRRVYLPRAVAEVVSQYPDAPGYQAWRAGIVRVQRDLVEEARWVRVRSVPGGAGGRGERWTVSSTSALVTFVLRVLRDAGALPQEELAQVAAAQDGAGLAAMEGPEADSESPEHLGFQLFAETLTGDLRRLALESASEVLR